MPDRETMPSAPAPEMSERAAALPQEALRIASGYAFSGPARLRAPESLMDAAEASAMEAAVAASPLTAKYAEAIDRESARELLAKKLEEGARKAAEDARVKEMAREQKNARVTEKASKPAKQEDSMVETVVKSRAFKDFMSTAAREIARGMFKSGRR